MSLKSSQQLNVSMPIRISKRYPKKSSTLTASNSIKAKPGAKLVVTEDKENDTRIDINGALKVIDLRPQETFRSNELAIIIERDCVESTDASAINSPLQSFIET